MPNVFLSDGWLDEIKQLRAPLDTLMDLVLNLRVTGGPEGDREVHLANLDFGAGFVDNARATVILPFATAKRMIVEGDQAVAMQAFMSGEVKVEGDMSALMGLMSTMAGGPLSPEDQQTVMAILRKKIEEITLPD